MLCPFYKWIVDEIHERPCVRKEDVFFRQWGSAIRTNVKRSNRRRVTHTLIDFTLRKPKMTDGGRLPASQQERVLAIKIARAMASGPREITKDATVAEMGADGKLVVLRQGTNEWVCFPGNENEIGNVPMCADPMGLQWMMDAHARKPKPTNAAPGLIYMLCGATQHSTTDPFDRTSPGIPVGPHWMIIWPFDAKRCGLPNTVRDAGTWVMFDGTP